MKPVVLTPSRDSVLATYASDLVELIRRNPTVQYGIALGSILSNLRLGMVEAALSNGATHILMIDSDMRFPPTTLEQLLARRVDIVGANCVPRGGRGTTARRADGSMIPSKGKTGIERAHIIGFGVALITADVFHTIAKPWFSMPFDGATGRHVTDDVFFCARANEAGFTVWVDHDLSQHVGHSAGFTELRI